MEFLKTIGILIVGAAKFIAFTLSMLAFAFCFFAALTFDTPPVERYWIPIIMCIGLVVFLLSIFWCLYYLHLMRLNRVSDSPFKNFYPAFSLESRLWTGVTRISIGLSLVYWFLWFTHAK